MSRPRTKGNVTVIDASSLYNRNDIDQDPERFLDKQEKRKGTTEGFNEYVDRNRKRAWQDVMALGARNLDKKAKKKHEEDRLRELGCQPDKKPKMPLKMLFSMKKTHAKRQARYQAENAGSQLVTTTSNVKKRKSTKSKHKKRADDIHGNPSGSFKGGILRVNVKSFI